MLLLSATALVADPASALESDPFWPTLHSPKLLTPQWIGEAGVEAAIVLAIDDMRIESVPKYEAFMRPIIERLKKTQGRAPISVMTCTADPLDPQLQTWVKEGLNMDVHTTRHPCPLLGHSTAPVAKGQQPGPPTLAAAMETVHEGLDLMSMIPGNKPVGFRMPCCDSMSSPSPRFYAEIFPKPTRGGNRLMIDSSVMNLITPADSSLPKEIVFDREGKDRFAKYFPGRVGDGAPASSKDAKFLQKSLRNFGTFIENYPYPYVINDSCWEFPCVVPSDWEAYNVLNKAQPQMLEDWKAALDAIVLKQGVFTLVFHPHGWSTAEQLVELIDYAEGKYGKRVKFLNFADAGERLRAVDKAAHGKPARKFPQGVALPEVAKQPGARFVDLNRDGHDDLVVSNEREYGVYLYNPVEKKNVQWEVGWTQVLREGKAGDANSLPLFVRADGSDNGVWFKHGALWVQNEDTAALPDKVRRIPYEELLRVPGPAPLSPQESLAAVEVKEGFEVALVAHEPQVQDPIFIDWDAKGRMWVVEMGDYPFAAGETTKDGKTGFQPKPGEYPLAAGRVKILEDLDGDGRYEKATTFLDGLKHATGLAFWGNGVFVSNIPDIFFAEDTDGDGKCDKRETWFTGFTAGNPQHLVNGFDWGLDGWLYGANGDSGGDIVCVKTGKKVPLGTNDFRFHPVSGEFQIEAGRTQCGKWRDDYGNWFGNNNSIWGWHYYLPMRYLERHPEHVVKALRANLNEDKTVYPISAPMRRFNWANATNTLTSGCNPMPYRDTAFGEDGRDAFFICEPANNLVHREVLDYTKVPLTSGRHAADAQSEFMASKDNWCRPVMARTGPDGALYVVDMYRLVLEHPEWIPAEIAKGLDLRAGEDKGRIYRVSKKGSRSEGARVAFDDPLKAISSTNGWMRDTAQRLLLEKRDASAVAPLQKVAAAPELPISARIQAAWTAHLLQGGQPKALITELQKHYPKVRGAALVAAGANDASQLRAEELATWFPKKSEAKAVADVPVITNSNPDRQKVVARYGAEAAKLHGDAKRGELVFQKACMACHKLGSMGVEVGPDLATVAAKPVEQILEAIFDPNRAVELRNAATQITKKDGAVLVGLIAAETPGGITLRLPGGVEMAVPTAEVRLKETLKTSLMPDGLESVITAQEAADLLARIQAK